jgi:hypothetical protein
LNERIERLERQLASQRKHLARRTRFTAIVALFLLIVLAGYFYFGYKNFDEVTRPAMIVQVAETFVDANLPELRKSLQAEIIRSAPSWAEQFSGELQAGMPQGRAQLENYIENQMEGMLDQASAFSQDQFRTFLRENRPVLEHGFQDLADSPTLAEETMKQVIDGLDKQLSHQMQLESSQLFETLSMMKKKLALLKTAQNLSNEQQLERRVLMLTRRLQLETVEPTLAGQTERPRAAIVPVADATPSAPPVEETGAEATEPAGDAKKDGAEQENDAAPAKDREQAGEESKPAPSPETESAKENEPANPPE